MSINHMQQCVTCVHLSFGSKRVFPATCCLGPPSGLPFPSSARNDASSPCNCSVSCWLVAAVTLFSSATCSSLTTSCNVDAGPVTHEAVLPSFFCHRINLRQADTRSVSQKNSSIYFMPASWTLQHISEGGHLLEFINFLSVLGCFGLCSSCGCKALPPFLQVSHLLLLLCDVSLLSRKQIVDCG